MDSIAKVIGYFVLALVAIGFISAWKEKRDADEGGPARPAVGTVSDDGSGLIICNRSVEPNSVALGSNEGESWVTRGWFQLDKQQCKTLARGVSGKTYYVYAEGIRGSVWRGTITSSVCTHEKSSPSPEPRSASRAASRLHSSSRFSWALTRTRSHTA